MRKRRRYQLRFLRTTFPTAPSFKNNSYSALGPAGGGRKTNLIVHSGIQTAPLHAKEYRLCEGNVIRVMQRIAFNMAVKRHMFPIGKQMMPRYSGRLLWAPAVPLIIVRAVLRNSSRVLRTSSP